MLQDQDRIGKKDMAQDSDVTLKNTVMKSTFPRLEWLNDEAPQKGPPVLGNFPPFSNLDVARISW